MGGASTKFAHLIWLLHRRHALTVVALDSEDLAETRWVQWLQAIGVRHCHWDDLPRQLDGWGVSLCNADFLGSPRWVDVRRRGLKMAWGNEMMWPMAPEAGAITLGQVDAVLYVSPDQRSALEPHYQRFLRGSLALRPIPVGNRATTGWICGRSPRDRVRWVMVGNYISPEAFPFRDRRTTTSPCVVGRLSRPDVTKFPEDFPNSYEDLGMRHPRFRVMSWSAELQARWKTHRFDERWDLLPSAGEDAAEFLRSLDLFVYELAPGCRESWGRAVVEAMLTGAVPLIPRGGGHHLDKLIAHGRSGFLCRDRAEFSQYARHLEIHPEQRWAVSRECRRWAIRRHCAVRAHLKLWDALFHGC